MNTADLVASTSVEMNREFMHFQVTTPGQPQLDVVNVTGAGDRCAYMHTYMHLFTNSSLHACKQYIRQIAF